MHEAALFAAIASGDAALVRDLLTRGAGPNACDSRGWPALFLAIDAGSVDAVQALLDQGADLTMKMTGDSALQIAAFRDNLVIARMLLERGAGVDVNFHGEEGDMPLKTAAGHGNIELVKLFLDAGADPEQMGGIDGGTALCVAAEGGHPEVVQLLLDRGSNPATRDLQYDTALDCVLSKNNREPSEQREAAIRILRKALETPR